MSAAASTSSAGRALPRPRASMPEVWAFVAVALPIVASLRARMSAIDLAYQVRAGELMLRTGSVLRTDPFSFTAFGRPWLDQQWGAQVVLAWLFRLGGWEGLALARAVLVGAVFWFVYLACRERGAGMRWAAALSLASFVVCAGGLNLRPQLLGLLLFAVTLWLVAARRRNPIRLWAVPAITLVWANTHGSFFLAPVLLGLSALEDRSERAPPRPTLAVLGTSVAASLVNPFGPAVWPYVADIATDEVIRLTITEWQAPTLGEYTGAAFFASVAGVSALLARRGRTVPWVSLLTLGVFFAIGLSAVRGVFWWALLAPVIVARIYSGPENAPSSPGPDEPRRPLHAVIPTLLVALGIAFLPWWRTTQPPGADDGVLTDAPPGLTQALREAAEPGDRLFNPQLWGSWIELSVPANPVFVDSRIEVFPRSLWEDYGDVSEGREGWQAVLDRYEIGVVVAHQRQQAGLLPRIRDDPGWRLAYEDAAGAVFVRARPAP